VSLEIRTKRRMLNLVVYFVLVGLSSLN